MSSRGIRVNELVMREISAILHTDYREQGVTITITNVQVAPDLRRARVYYSVIGNQDEVERAERFFKARSGDIRRKLSRTIVLKYLPNLRFIHDNSLERGSRVVDILNEIDEQPHSKNSAPAEGNE